MNASPESTEPVDPTEPVDNAAAAQAADGATPSVDASVDQPVAATAAPAAAAPVEPGIADASQPHASTSPASAVDSLAADGPEASAAASSAGYAAPSNGAIRGSDAATEQFTQPNPYGAQSSHYLASQDQTPTAQTPTAQTPTAQTPTAQTPTAQVPGAQGQYPYYPYGQYQGGQYQGPQYPQGYLAQQGAQYPTGQYPGQYPGQPGAYGTQPPTPGTPGAHPNFHHNGFPPPPAAKHKGTGWIIAAASTAAALMVIAGVGGVAAFATHAFANNTSQQTTQSDPSQGNSFGRGNGGGNGSLTDPNSQGQGQSQSGSGTANTRAATDAESVGVVEINTDLAYQGAAAAGTGMILTSDGRILTNNHVVAGATSITVTVVSTGKQYTAKVVGTDATDDVAVIQLDGASGLTPITVDQDGVNVGDAVTGVGNAGGKGGTPTAAEGKITALDQNITVQDDQTGQGKSLSGLIETDADIQAGDSGGPLYDAQGEVVGIDTAASSGSTDIDGFAIPIDHALDIVKQIESGVETDTIKIGYPAFIGIGLAADGQSGAVGGGVNGSTGGQTTVGAGVASVIPNTPAAGLGLVAGDVITSLNGVAIDSAATLTTTMQSLEPGQTVSITWTDTAGTSHTASITLIEGPAS